MADVDRITMKNPDEPVLGSSEHDTAMASKFEAAQQHQKDEGAKDTKPQAPSKPEGVPDKFWNAETGAVDYAAWANAHAELEKRFTQEQQEKAVKKEDKSEEIDPEAAARKADEQKLAEGGLKMEELTEEFAKNGELSEESYRKLEKAGFGRSYVAAYIAGQKALAEKFEAEVVKSAGGKEQFQAMQQWAAKGLTESEIAAFNNAVSSGDVGQAALAVRGLMATYQAAMGAEPALISGAPAAAGGGGFRSLAEQTAAINKTDDKGRRLYDRDPAYRADVENKIRNATY